MRKSFSRNKIKKNRGVAVIFTLGILGLLTVMALGFASTALLNRKIADNTSSAEYARHIAKNIALARAKWAVMNTAIANSIYTDSLSTYTTENGKKLQDFLYKMDTVLDGVEIYRITNDSGQIQPKTARWQYVYGPETDPVSNQKPILGRYTYAVVSSSGRLDPVANLGDTSVSGRYGFSEKELKLPAAWNDPLKAKLATLGTNRWKSFYEVMQALAATDANRRTFFTDGVGIRQQPSQEAFWLDIGTQDGKKTENELYLRFNMPTTDSAWSSMTVDDLIGKNVTPSDEDIKYNGSNNSISFIPWLKYWEHSASSDWTADRMKKQIAANIIQYNRPSPDALDTDGTPIAYTTVSSSQTGNWLTDAGAPEYAGIGRHPMLNEIGFSIRVKAEVERKEKISDDPITYKYEARYVITIENGVELINPFSATHPEKCFVKFSDDLEINLLLRTFQENLTTLTINNENDLDNLFYKKEFSWAVLGNIVKALNLKIKGGNGVASKELKRISAGLISNQDPTPLSDPIANIREGGWTNFTFDRVFDGSSWNSDPAYTKAEKFWNKETKTIVYNEFALANRAGDTTDTDHSEKIRSRMRFYRAQLKLGNVVLYCGRESDTADIAHQRDFAKLADTEEVKTTIDWSTLLGSGGGGTDISSKAWLGLYSIEAKDPLVNHYASDWGEVKHQYTDYDELSPGDIGKINREYTGSVFDSDGGNGNDECHRNKEVMNGETPVPLLKDNENGSEFVLESATDPAYSSSSRLSSSYIRHAPMKSFWELGFISRAEAFKTLNLGRTRVFAPGTAYDARGGGTFAQGDANLLDQIKFSDPTDQKNAYGKVNLNARYHKVFEQLFNTDGTTAVTWRKGLISGSETDPYNATPVSGDTQKVVCDVADCLTQTCNDPCSVDGCLAHLLMERSKILPFANRSDLLLDPSAAGFSNLPGYSDLSATDKTKLNSIQQNLRDFLFNPSNINLSSANTSSDAKNARSKLVREQYATRFMNLLKTDPADDHVYIIILAQSIRDIGGTPVFVDWNGDGEYTPAGSTAPAYQATARFLKTGFVRKKLYADAYETISPSSGSAPTLTETQTAPTVGNYDFGADKITGETKMIVEMTRDVITGKWRMTGYRYVE